MFSFEILYESWKTTGLNKKIFPDSLLYYYFSHAFGLAYLDYQFAEQKEFDKLKVCVKKFENVISEFKSSNIKLLKLGMEIYNFDKLEEQLNYYHKSLITFNDRIMDEKELSAQDIFDKFSLKVLFYSNNYKYDRICGKINKNIKSTIKDLNNELDNLKPIFDKSKIEYSDIPEWIDLSFEI